MVRSAMRSAFFLLLSLSSVASAQDVATARRASHEVAGFTALGEQVSFRGRTWGREMRSLEAPRVSVEAARARHGLEAAHEVVDRVAFPGDDAHFPVYRFSLQRAQSVTHVYVDARSGELLLRVPAEVHATGRVYDPNPVVADEMTSDVELPRLTRDDQLTGEYVDVSSCPATGMICDPVRLASPDEFGDYLYEPQDPSYDDPFSEVNAYFHADKVAEYFRREHGFRWTCCGDAPPITLIANYTEIPGFAFRNAFYRPNECSRSVCGLIAMGQGLERDFAYDGDVVYHEFVHAVVDVQAGLQQFDPDPFLGLNYVPSAINEGYADYFSSAVTGDPVLGEYFGSAPTLGGEGSSRRLDNDRTCDRDQFGESHRDGTIWAGALWSIREAVGGSTADTIAFNALSMMPSLPTFDDAASLLIMAAEQLRDEGGEDAVEVVRAEVERRALVGCEPIVTLESGVAVTAYSGSPPLTGNFGRGVAPIHYRLPIPEDATAVRVRIRSLSSAGDYVLFVKRFERPLFRLTRRPPLIADEQHETLNEIEIDDLPRCSDLYLSVITRDLLTRGASVFELVADVDLGGTEGCSELPDAGLADAGADAGDAGDAEADAAVLDGSTDASTDGGGGAVDDGCSCHAPGGDAPMRPAGIFVLGLLVLMRRRRRRPSTSATPRFTL